MSNNINCTKCRIDDKKEKIECIDCFLQSHGMNDIKSGEGLLQNELIREIYNIFLTDRFAPFTSVVNNASTNNSILSVLAYTLEQYRLTYRYKKE